MLQTCSDDSDHQINPSDPLKCLSSPPKVSAHLKDCANAFDLASKAADDADDRSKAEHIAIWTKNHEYLAVYCIIMIT